jgi:hypothetical protein
MYGLTFSTAFSKTSIGSVGNSRATDFFQGVVKTLGGRLLAVEHQAIDELAGQHRIVPRVALELRAAGGDTSHRENFYL